MTTRTDQEKVCYAITGLFEGRGYVNLAGNFDGAGWSLGFLQWNFGSGTLQPMIRAMEAEGPKTFRAALGDEKAAELLRVAQLPKAQAVAWADALSTGSRKRGIREDWVKALRKLLAVPGFQAVQRHFAAPYMADARRDVEFFGLDTLRALALCFDVSVQNGQGKIGKISQAAFRDHFAAMGGQALPYERKLKAIAISVAKTSRIVHGDRDPFWIQKDVEGRKLLIVKGTGNFRGSFWDLTKMGLTDERLV